MNQEVIDYLSVTQIRVKQAQLEIDNIIKNNHQNGLAQIISQEDPRLENIETQKNTIFDALSRVSDNLAKSYAQVKNDIGDDSRLSWAGTAHEIREVLGTMLRLLAPDGDVGKQAWYKQEPNTSGPTQKQRVHYILLAQSAGSKEGEVVEQVGKLESMIEDLVRSTYARASDAAHRFKPKSEVIRILRYFEAFAYDLLNLNE